MGATVHDRVHTTVTPGDRDTGGTATDAAPVRVMLVAQLGLVTESIHRALDTEVGITVAAMIEPPVDLRAETRELRPDVLLVIDRSVAEVHLEILQQADGCLDPPVVLIGDHARGTDLAAALSAGCAGLVAWDGPFAELVTTIRVVAGGGSRVPLALVPEMTAAFRRRNLPTDLSDRELEVLALLAQGFATGQMAMHLMLSIHTVRNHIRSLMAKLDAHTRLEAVVTARRRGLIDDMSSSLSA
jgi:DNA-binding NarL/FixJ family response regulator